MPADTIYDELGVPTVVNAAGTKTRIGGSLIRPAALEAMTSAGESFVRISDLQARASELIAEATGAQAGYVASGAAACLTLGTAACIAGADLGVMDRLPHSVDAPDEVVIPVTHRNGYDHAIRAAGARLVPVGTADTHLGTGSTDTERWELAAAIGEETAAVAYVQTPDSRPPLADVCAVAHDHDVPVIVDAAAELPPASNLSRFLEAGADLVAFSGGKAIRGPQSTGFLAGRADLVASAAVQHLDTHVAAAVWEPPASLVDRERFAGVPRQGIGRSCKVGKEELAGFIRALECFLEEDHEALAREWRERTERVVATLETDPSLSVSIVGGEKTAVVPEASVSLDPDRAGVDVETLVGALRREDPRVFVGSDHLDESAFTVNPRCLTDEQADYVAERVLAHIG